jgi:hypothetical protein
MSSSRTWAEETALQLRHERIDGDPPCGRLTFCLAADLTGNGRDDVVVGGTGSRRRLYVDGEATLVPSLAGLKSKIGFPETNLFWYENPGWQRRKLGDVNRLGAGHATTDVDGDGRTDVVAGQARHDRGVYWFRQPDDPRRTWRSHLVTSRYGDYTDLAVADVDDDGDEEVVGLGRADETIFYYDVPADPMQSPWPDECRHVVASDRAVEGLAVLDVDGDGRTEIVAGTDVYRRQDAGGDRWRRESIVEGWDDVRVATADLDGDGGPEVILAEGDSPVRGTHPGRVAWFDPDDWEPHVIRDDLFCPHSLQVADFTGDGRPDILVGEMGLGKHDDPGLYVFVNRGDGTFSERVVSRGVAAHGAKVADLTGNGRPDVVGKSYDPDPHVDVWYNGEN